MSCPYTSEELDRWDGVCNPMGKACDDCGEWECEHNPNGDPTMPDFDPYDNSELLEGISK